MAVRRCSICSELIPVVRFPQSFRQAVWGGWTCSGCGTEFNRFGQVISSLEPTSFAGNPVHLAISEERLREIRPDLYGFRGRLERLKVSAGLTWDQMTYIQEHLKNGDSRAAVVISVNPLRIAAYSDELDAIAMLAFPTEFADAYQLVVRARLLTINTYKRDPTYDRDLVVGPNALDRWSGFHPIIAEFVSDEEEKIDKRKDAIEESEWIRAERMGLEYFEKRPKVARDGRPIYSAVPASVR